MTKLSAKTATNQLQSCIVLRKTPDGPFKCPESVHLAPSRGAKPVPDIVARQLCDRVAFWGEEQPVTPGITVLTGRDKCARAHIVIVPGLEVFHDAMSIAADKKLVVHLLYIIAGAKPVVARSTWKASAGDVKRLDPHAIVHHARASGGKTTIRFSPAFSQTIYCDFEVPCEKRAKT